MVDTPIGTNSPNYTLVSGDLGATIYCRVTATNASGSSNAISNVVGPITSAVAPANAGGANLPNIADTTPEVTIAVSCTTGTWTGDPTILYSYQWKRGGVNVGTDSSSYTPVVGDIGATLQCVVTATNGAGSALATSNTTGAVAAAPAEGAPASTNLWTWLKADAGTFQEVGMTTPATADNAEVQGWQDQSGNGKHYTQAVVPPILKTNILNTKPVLRFDNAVSQRLDGPSAAALTAGEIFIVVKAVSDPGAGVDGNCLWGFGSSTDFEIYPYSDNHIYEEWGTTVRKDTGDPGPLLNAWQLYNVVSTASEFTTFLDNVQHFTTATNTVGFSPTNVIGGSIDFSAWFAGDIAEVIIYSAKCSAPDKLTTVTYLSNKYALGIV